MRSSEGLEEKLRVTFNAGERAATQKLAMAARAQPRAPIAAREPRAPRRAAAPARRRGVPPPPRAAAADPALAPPDADPSSASAASSRARGHEADVVIVGAGIGGLCCAALLVRYGYAVTVLEAHYHAGGAAHGFVVPAPGGGGGRYEFDAGPSFFAGIGGPVGAPSSNPLKQARVLGGLGVQNEGSKR